MSPFFTDKGLRNTYPFSKCVACMLCMGRCCGWVVTPQKSIIGLESSLVCSFRKENRLEPLYTLFYNIFWDSF